MSGDGDQNRSWRLFTSEDMIQGYKALKRRKTTRNVKKNNSFRNTEAHGFCSAVPTSELSSAIAKRLKSKHKKSNSKEERSVRKPFTDVTNNYGSLRSKKEEVVDKAEPKYSKREDAELKECCRNLFEEEFSQGGSRPGIVYDKNCEETRLSNPEFAKRALDRKEEKRMTMTTVENMNKLGKEAIEAFFVAHVKITSIDKSIKWFYNACTSCDKETKMENPCPICESCNRYVPYPQKKFRIHVVAEDASGQMQVILGDREVRTIVGRRASDIFDEVSTAQAMPNSLFSILQKEYTLVIQIKEINIVKNLKVYWATNIYKGFVNLPAQATEDVSNYEPQTSQATTSTYNAGGISNVNLSSNLI